MRIFDSHIHIYPDKIASKAAQNIGQFYNIEMDSDGTLAHLLDICEKNGIKKCLVHSVATKHDQVPKINDFIYSAVQAHPDMFVGFCTLHPDMDVKETEAELDRVIKMGLRGIKLHPDCQKFRIDDKHAMEMYEVIDGRLPILFHTGDKRFDYSNPDRMKRMALRFPKQRVIAAHFGGYSVWEDAVKTLPGLDNLWVDESSSLPFITPEKAKEYINAYGDDRVFFGTDYPMWDAKDELERFDRIDLTDTQREKILWKNAADFLSVNS